VIAATRTDLASLVDQGLFREDLYYRLNVIGLSIPPLRERREEIPSIVEFFLDRYTRQYMRPRTVITPSAMTLLCSYPWPGNIRELESTVKRIVVLGTQDWLAHGLAWPEAAPPPSPLPGVTAAAPTVTAPPRADVAPSLTAIARAAALQAERGALKQVLDHVRWNRRAAARLLKVSYRTLRRKIAQCGLDD
jgi:DNA-binding NtrC family response regulator